MTAGVGAEYAGGGDLKWQNLLYAVGSGRHGAENPDVSATALYEALRRNHDMMPAILA